jgi:Protein of unknown function (DUF1360)
MSRATASASSQAHLSMTDNATDAHAANGASVRTAKLASQNAPVDERPLASYAILAGTYGGALAASLVILHARGHELPEHFTAADMLLVGVASHKLSRLITRGKVTSFLRAPTTRFQRSSGHGEVEEEPRGHGLRFAVGELLVCPYCIAQWIATGLTVGLVGAPRVTRLLSTISVAHTVSDFLQVVYRAAENQSNGDRGVGGAA